MNGESYIMIYVAILRLTSLEGLIDDDHERAQTCIIFPYKCISAKCNLIQGMYIFYISKGHIVRSGSHMLNSFLLSLSCIF